MSGEFGYVKVHKLPEPWSMLRQDPDLRNGRPFEKILNPLLQRGAVFVKNGKILEWIDVRNEMSREDTKRTPQIGLPPKQGLYDPQFEHDSCGVGFVVNIKGKKSHKIIRDALTALINLNHRGACGCEANTGDGAGILMQIPHGFFKEVSRKDKIKLPPLGDYGVAMVFLPRDANERRTCKKTMATQ